MTQIGLSDNLLGFLCTVENIYGTIMSFTILVNTFANNILPIVLLGGAGFALGKSLHLDSRSLGRVVFYILALC